MTYRVAMRIATPAGDIPVGSVVTDPKWPNTAMLVGAGYLVPCDAPKAQQQQPQRQQQPQNGARR